MQPEIEPEGTDLREYIAILRQRKWSVLLIVALVVGVATYFTSQATPVYESTSRVLILPIAPANSAFFFLADINMDTEAGLVESATVARIVQENLRLKGDPLDLLGGLSVSVEGATEILDVSYGDSSPAYAQRLAQGFAEGYLQFRQQQAQEQVGSQIDSAQSDIDATGRKISDLSAKLAQTHDAGQQSELTTQLDAARARLGVLQQKLADLRSTTALQSPGQIVEPSELPISPSNAGYVQNGFLALILGLALGVGLAFVRERLDDRLRRQDDLEKSAGVPVLAVVPKVQGWIDKRKPRVVMLQAPRAPASEAYRTLRTSVMFMASKRRIKTIMIASPSAGDGKTTTVANLSVALAQTGKRVIVVSADLRKPRLHRFFDMSNDRGLVQVLDGTAELAKVLQRTKVVNLVLLPCGPIPEQPAEMLQSPLMPEIFDELERHADFVIIDAAPALVVSDSLALAGLVDGVIFVAQAEETTRQAVVRAREQLGQVGAVIVGAVLNNFDPNSPRGGGDYYRHYYRYGYKTKGYGTDSYADSTTTAPVDGNGDGPGFTEPGAFADTSGSDQPIGW